MKNNSYKKISFIIAGVSTFIVFTVYGVMYFFIKSEVGYVSEKYLELQKKESRAEQKKITENTKTSLVNELDQLDARFATGDDSVAIINELERFAAGKNVVVKIGDISNEIKEEGVLDTLNMSVTISGSWRSIISFVEDLKDFKYAVKIVKIKFMSDKGEDKKSLSWVAVLDMEVPVFKSNSIK